MCLPNITTVFGTHLFKFGLQEQNTCLSSFNTKYLFLITLKNEKPVLKGTVQPMSAESLFADLHMLTLWRDYAKYKADLRQTVF